jgi:hypothetical protein
VENRVPMLGLKLTKFKVHLPRYHKRELEPKALGTRALATLPPLLKPPLPKDVLQLPLPHLLASMVGS